MQDTTGFSLICRLFLVISSFSALSTAKDVPLKEYVINLDSPAKDHWKDVTLDHKDIISNIVAYMRQSDPSMFDMLSIMASSVLEEIPNPYRDELMGIAEYCNLTIGEVLIYNMYYEMTAYNKDTDSRACTSIVAMLLDGNVIHGRNLDYGIPGLNKISVNLDFQKNGKTTYKGTTFAGYIGLLTAFKPDGFSISVDERDQGQWSRNDYESAKLGPKGIVAFKMRDLVANDSMTFQSAVETLSTTELIAPCYIIVGGVKNNEGVVITHNRTGAIDIWHLNSTKTVASAEQWFLVETNYDHWVDPPKQDNRRDPAIKMMQSFGQQNLSSDSLFKVLSTSPVLNSGTTYTTLMSAGTGLFQGWARNL